MTVTLLSLWHQCQAWWVCGQCSATGRVHLHRSALGEVSVVRAKPSPALWTWENLIQISYIYIYNI